MGHRTWFVRAEITAMMLVMTLAGCGSIELKSLWRDRPVEIDGRNDEWQNAMMLIGGKKAMVGLLNDSNYLYVCFVTDDRSILRQVMFRGLTVWFDKRGGEEKRFGIHFPLGAQRMGGPGTLQDRIRDQNLEDTLRERFPIDTNEVEIMGPMENEHRRLSITELKQISVKVGVSKGNMVYELRVPLMDNGPDPYAVGTEAGKKIGIGLETGVRPEGRQPEGGGFGREGSPGGFGRGRRDGDQGGGGGRPQRSGELQAGPFKMWASVILAFR